MIALIVAYSKNRVIGYKGCIPWKIKGEQKRFRELTMGNVVIMGRRSFEEIGHPLPNRFTIVISRSRKYEYENCTTASSLAEALEMADNDKDIYIAGGAMLYKEALPLVDKMYITEIDKEIEGDTVFPDFDENEYNKCVDERFEEEIPFTYITYTRKREEPSAVIFDMDGLMFDTERVFIKAWDYAGEKIGVGKAGYMVMKTLGMNIKMSRQIWIDEFGTSYDEDGLRKYTKEFLVKYYNENKVPIKPGLLQLLSFLKKKRYKIAVASSSPEWEVKKHLVDADILDYFQVIVCGDMIEISKPNPEIHIKACELLCENPKDCYALEDSKNGLLAANNAGCKVIMIPDLWQPDEEIKKILYEKFDNLNEVRDWLMQGNKRLDSVKSGLSEVELRLAETKDAELIHEMKYLAFDPLYQKYQDHDINPALEPLEKTVKLINQDYTDYYIIQFDQKSVGAIRVVKKEKGILRISPLFIIPDFQNKGIASKVFELLFEKYSEAVVWRLDTILQEDGNCHLYEKIGFVKTGKIEKINDKMTLVHYDWKKVLY